jgi:hypothetical protein
LYGDWTKPSRSGSAPADVPQQPGIPVAPSTTAIPERDTGRRRSGAAYDDDLDRDLDRDGTRYDVDDEPYGGRYDDRAGDDRADHHTRGDYDEEPPRVRGPVTGPSTGPSTEVRGGRAAYRAERQAFDAERRKEEKRKGESMSARDYLDGKDEPRGPRGTRRKMMALVSAAVIALGVLGVWSFTSPKTQETASRTPVTASSAPPSGVAGTSALPPLVSDVPSVSSAPSTPIRLPVTVLNATSTNGLAGRISSALQAGGWPAGGIGQYSGGDIASTTVFFAAGNENQREAALQLVNQFPQIIGPTTLFFPVPDQTAPGLVVVAAGDWQP